MKKLLPFIFIIFLLTIYAGSAFGASSFNLTIDSRFYTPGSYIYLDVRSSVNEWYTVEILKGDNTMMSIPLDSADLHLRILIPINWEPGSDYLIRAGQGSDFDYADFEVSATGMPKVEAVSASPGSSEVSANTKINLATSTPGAVIYYTTDGSMPTSTATRYTSGGILITQTVTIKAVAILSGYEDSDVLTVSYTVILPEPPVPPTPPAPPTPGPSPGNPSNNTSASGGVGGGGGGGPATITGGNGTIPLMYTLNGGTVELFLIEKEISDIIENTINKITVFDMSRTPNFTGVRMPKASLEKFVGDSDGFSTRLKMPKGIIDLDNNSLKSVITQAGPYITFSLTEVKYDSLNAAQKAVVNPDNQIVNITVVSGAKSIRDFDGSLTVFIPYEGPTPAKAWYLSDAGILEEMAVVYDSVNKMVSFRTSHLSLYVLGKELIQSGTRIRLAIGSLTYMVGGVAKRLDAAPAIANDRTMVPLRFIAEALGAKVDWNEDSRVAAVALDGKSLSVTIDKIAPGMDVPAMIINGRTMVPLRYIGEALGCDVAWDPDTRSIDITK